MKIDVLIPARSGSKRIPGKNIKELNGVPLLAHSILTAQELKQMGIIENIWVSSDDPEYLDIAGEYGAIIHLRRQVAAQDNSLDFDVITDWLPVSRADLIVYLRPTTPRRSASKVAEAIQTMIDAGDNATGLRSVHEMSESAWKAFTIYKGYLDPVIRPFGTHYRSVDDCNNPNQKYDATYKGNGYVDIVKRDTVLQGQTYGNRCIAFITKPVTELDTEEEWAYLEWQMGRMRRDEAVY